MYWTDEEAKFIKAVVSWNDSLEPKKVPEKKDTVGELRIVVIGAKGTGKTAILTRVCAPLPATIHCARRDSELSDQASQFCIGVFNPHLPPDPFYERGARHPVQVEDKWYMMDALEMPSQHISSDPMLEQALNITDGAIVTYDVKDPTSLTVAHGICEFIGDHLGSREYALLLVGNKSDVDDTIRKVAWAEGSKASGNVKAKCAFLEVSARSGDNIDRIFPTIGEEILRAKAINQRERQKQESEVDTIVNEKLAKPPPKRKQGLWKTIIHPFSRR
jgi:GTPase SAR1 family protein